MQYLNLKLNCVKIAYFKSHQKRERILAFSIKFKQLQFDGFNRKANTIKFLSNNRTENEPRRLLPSSIIPIIIIKLMRSTSTTEST